MIYGCATLPGFDASEKKPECREPDSEVAPKTRRQNPVVGDGVKWAQKAGVETR
jgi:hypothetical protein